MVEGAVDAALEDGPDRFDAVDRHVVADVLTRPMIDGLVLIVEISQARIATPFIRVDSRAKLNVIQDREFECSGIRSIYRHRLGPSAALAHAEHDRLVHTAASSDFSLSNGLVHILGGATDISLVDRDYAPQFVELCRDR